MPAGHDRLIAGGGDAGELAEIADQVGLVGVAGVGCDLSPVQRAALVDVPPHPVEPDQAGRGLGPQPGLPPELDDQVLMAPAHLVGDLADRYRAPGCDQPLPRPADLWRGPRPVGHSPQQELVHQRKPLPPARRLAQLPGQPPGGAAE